MAELFSILFVVILLAAILLFIASRKTREQTGLPFNARMVYSDSGAWEKVEKPLFSRRYLLTGKPDYMIEDNGATIPIEVKPNRVSSAPRESDVMQLAAYALLIEESFGAKPPHGLLKYRDAVFRVDFTDELRGQLIDLMEAMRGDLEAQDVARSHAEPPRCFGCGYREDCGQSF
ncbi:MAG: CRISPR-associated protein Cas4 [Chloroflexi bacterium]|nr:CRISPR-associated protein Cas4 [Chloroflexota bacterium]